MSALITPFLESRGGLAVGVMYHSLQAFRGRVGAVPGLRRVMKSHGGIVGTVIGHASRRVYSVKTRIET
jgi:hypothetical protein